MLVEGIRAALEMKERHELFCYGFLLLLSLGHYKIINYTNEPTIVVSKVNFLITFKELFLQNTNYAIAQLILKKNSKILTLDDSFNIYQTRLLILWKLIFGSTFIFFCNNLSTFCLEVENVLSYFFIIYLGVFCN